MSREEERESEKIEKERERERVRNEGEGTDKGSEVRTKREDRLQHEMKADSYQGLLVQAARFLWSGEERASKVLVLG